MSFSQFCSVTYVTYSPAFFWYTWSFSCRVVLCSVQYVGSTWSLHINMPLIISNGSVMNRDCCGADLSLKFAVDCYEYIGTADSSLVAATVPVVDGFGWTTFIAMEPKPVSQTVNTATGAITTARTMSTYLCFVLRVGLLQFADQTTWYTIKAIVVPDLMHRTSNVKSNKMLSYRRETALQGAL